MINFYIIFILIGVAQAIVLSIAMLGKVNETNSTRKWLIALCILLAISLTEGAIDIAELELQYIHFTILVLPINGLFLPLYYAYISDMVGYKPNATFCLHFIPSLLIFLMMMPIITLDSESLIGLLNGTLQVKYFDNWIPITLFLLVMVIIIQGIYYIPACFRFLSGYKALISEKLSFNERISLAWLKVMTISLSIVWCILIIILLTGELFANYLLIILHVTTALLIIGLNIFGLQQENIFKQLGIDVKKLTSSLMNTSTPEKNKYQRSSLDKALAEKLCQSTLTFMQNERPFLDNELSLSSLAKSLDLPTHYLSQIINQIEKQNFFEFINGYRVQFAKELLLNSDDTVLKIAMDSGFNSKTTFYKVFKKDTSMSPSQYRQQNNGLK